MAIIGTCYFPTKRDAVRYYAQQGDTMEDVERKLNEGLIHIGKPMLKEGQRIIRLDNGLRYGIEEV